MKYTEHPDRLIRYILSAPFIYGMIIPVLFLDICAEVYHRICFKLYGLEYVERSKYIRIDRHKLRKLNTIQKINCIYCGYVNGLFKYVSVIAGETEKFWCAIKHEPNDGFIEPEYHTEFADYGDYL